MYCYKIYKYKVYNQRIVKIQQLIVKGHLIKSLLHPIWSILNQLFQQMSSLKFYPFSSSCVFLHRQIKTQNHNIQIVNTLYMSNPQFKKTIFISLIDLKVDQLPLKNRQFLLQKPQQIIEQFQTTQNKSLNDQNNAYCNVKHMMWISQPLRIPFYHKKEQQSLNENKNHNKQLNCKLIKNIQERNQNNTYLQIRYFYLPPLSQYTKYVQSQIQKSISNSDTDQKNNTIYFMNKSNQQNISLKHQLQMSQQHQILYSFARSLSSYMVYDFGSKYIRFDHELNAKDSQLLWKNIVQKQLSKNSEQVDNNQIDSNSNYVKKFITAIKRQYKNLYENKMELNDEIIEINSKDQHDQVPYYVVLKNTASKNDYQVYKVNISIANQSKNNNVKVSTSFTSTSASASINSYSNNSSSSLHSIRLQIQSQKIIEIKNNQNQNSINKNEQTKFQQILQVTSRLMQFRQTSEFIQQIKNVQQLIRQQIQIKKNTQKEDNSNTVSQKNYNQCSQNKDNRRFIEQNKKEQIKQNQQQEYSLDEQNTTIHQQLYDNKINKQDQGLKQQPQTQKQVKQNLFSNIKLSQTTKLINFQFLLSLLIKHSNKYLKQQLQFPLLDSQSGTLKNAFIEYNFFVSFDHYLCNQDNITTRQYSQYYQLFYNIFIKDQIHRSLLPASLKQNHRLKSTYNNQYQQLTTNASKQLNQKITFRNLQLLQTIIQKFYSQRPNQINYLPIKKINTNCENHADKSNKHNNTPTWITHNIKHNLKQFKQKNIIALLHNQSLYIKSTYKQNTNITHLPQPQRIYIHLKNKLFQHQFQSTLSHNLPLIFSYPLQISHLQKTILYQFNQISTLKQKITQSTNQNYQKQLLIQDHQRKISLYKQEQKFHQQILIQLNIKEQKLQQQIDEKKKILIDFQCQKIQNYNLKQQLQFSKNKQTRTIEQKHNFLQAIAHLSKQNQHFITLSKQRLQSINELNKKLQKYKSIDLQLSNVLQQNNLLKKQNDSIKQWKKQIQLGYSKVIQRECKKLNYILQMNYNKMVQKQKQNMGRKERISVIQKQLLLKNGKIMSLQQEIRYLKRRFYNQEYGFMQIVRKGQIDRQQVETNRQQQNQYVLFRD